uniref:Uncharacterized protein n=1 Tax=Arundo donax TaxID=35708 RepID=A0A0A9GGV8_ARUDO
MKTTKEFKTQGQMKIICQKALCRKPFQSRGVPRLHRGKRRRAVSAAAVAGRESGGIWSEAREAETGGVGVGSATVRGK